MVSECYLPVAPNGQWLLLLPVVLQAPSDSIPFPHPQWQLLTGIPEEARSLPLQVTIPHSRAQRSQRVQHSQKLQMTLVSGMADLSVSLTWLDNGGQMTCDQSKCLGFWHLLKVTQLSPSWFSVQERGMTIFITQSVQHFDVSVIWKTRNVSYHFLCCFFGCFVMFCLCWNHLTCFVLWPSCTAVQG